MRFLAGRGPSWLQFGSWAAAGAGQLPHMHNDTSGHPNFEGSDTLACVPILVSCEQPPEVRERRVRKRRMLHLALADSSQWPPEAARNTTVVVSGTRSSRHRAEFRERCPNRLGNTSFDTDGKAGERNRRGVCVCEAAFFF